MPLGGPAALSDGAGHGASTHAAVFVLLVAGGRSHPAGHVQLQRALGADRAAGDWRPCRPTWNCSTAGGPRACMCCTWRCSWCCWSAAGRRSNARWPSPPHVSFWATVPLLAAILIRCGTVPVHCWLTDWFEHASLGIALLYVHSAGRRVCRRAAGVADRRRLGAALASGSFRWPPPCTPPAWPPSSAKPGGFSLTCF